MKKSYSLHSILTAIIITVYIPVFGQTTVELPSGTVVTASITQEINSKTATVNERVNLRVENDIYINNKIAIKRDALVVGQIVEVKKAKATGRAGKIVIKLVSVTAVDGQVINLYSKLNVKAGEDNHSMLWIAAVGGCFVISPISFFALCFKGDNIILKSGTIYDGIVEGNYSISIN